MARNGFYLAVAALLVLSGCATWPEERDGVKAADLRDKRAEYCEGVPGRAPCPRASSCWAVANNAGKSIPLSHGSSQDYWRSCLRELDRVKTWADNKKAQYAAEKAAEKEAIRLDSEKREKERRERGPEFFELYEHAYRNGAEAANRALAHYGGKVRFHELLVVNNCNSGICTIELATQRAFGSGGMAGFGFDMISKGIHAEPGTPLSSFKLLRFEEYGQGVYRNPIAVFTSR